MVEKFPIKLFVIPLLVSAKLRAQNSDCQGIGKNCQKDGSCKSCTSNPDCGVTDGGEVTDQPACDTASGQCTACRSNNDCPSSTPNCGDDGGCYHCNAPGNRCGSMDGPQGGPNDGQPHCDALTGLCVNYCTADDQCPDECAPRCHLNRGCCVQCLESDDCPLANWRADQAAYTTCSVNSFTCVKGCSVDDDCSTDDKPACSATSGDCVECLYDYHCSDGVTTVCASSQTCVECVTDAHCDEGESCVELQCTTRTSATSTVTAGVLSLISAFVLLF